MELIFLLSGIVIGGTIIFLFFNKSIDGVLRIDKSDEDAPYLFLEIKKSVGYLETRKFVRLKVKQENFISHK